MPKSLSLSAAVEVNSPKDSSTAAGVFMDVVVAVVVGPNSIMGPKVAGNAARGNEVP